MVKINKRLIGFITLLIILSALSGCTQKNNELIAKTVNGVDISKHIELITYTIGEPPKDLQRIEDAVNKILLRDLNTTIQLNMLPWADWEQKYNLMLSSGQPVDMMFASDWAHYSLLAHKGAFQPLDELLTKYAPNYMKIVDPQLLNAMKVDGKVYGTPHLWKEYVPEGFTYREDLRKKYNLPEINSIETIEAYLEGIKLNEPSMMPTDSAANPFYFMYKYQYKHFLFDGIGSNYGLKVMSDNPSEIVDDWASPEYLNSLKLAKKWMDAGYWPKSVLYNHSDQKGEFMAGKVAALMQGLTDPNQNADTVTEMANTHSNWEVGSFPYSNLVNFIYAASPYHCSIVIPKQSENAERVALLIDKIFTDPNLNHLLQYGIEGVHYNVTKEGKYEQIINSNQPAYGREALNSWNYRNPAFMLFPKTYDVVLKQFKEWDKISVPNILGGFAEDKSNYLAESAAVSSLVTQYLYPIQSGLIANPEKALQEFIIKAKAAGLDKIRTDFSLQWKQYIKENNGFKK